MRVARNIETLMAARKTDAAKLARDAKLNPTGIYDILKGKSKSPKIGTIAKIAKALEVPVSIIFSESVDVELRKDLMFVFDSLSEQEQRRLVTTGRAWME